MCQCELCVIVCVCVCVCVCLRAALQCYIAVKPDGAGVTKLQQLHLPPHTSLMNCAR